VRTFSIVCLRLPYLPLAVSRIPRQTSSRDCPSRRWPSVSAFCSSPTRSPSRRRKVTRVALPPAWLPPTGLSTRWTAIVIHHTASETGSLTDINQWHPRERLGRLRLSLRDRQRHKSGDGQIEVGPRWVNQSTGAHTRLYGQTSSAEGNYYNEHGIGIVLVGNMDEAGPTAKQLDSLVRLIGYLSNTCHIPLSHVYCHGELKSTDCPGQYFPKVEVRRRLMDAVARAAVTDEPAGG